MTTSTAKTKSYRTYLRVGRVGTVTSRHQESNCQQHRRCHHHPLMISFKLQPSSSISRSIAFGMHSLFFFVLLRERSARWKSRLDLQREDSRKNIPLLSSIRNFVGGNAEPLEEKLFPRLDRVGSEGRPARVVGTARKAPMMPCGFPDFPSLNGTESGATSREIGFCVCYCYPHFIASVLELVCAWCQRWNFSVWVLFIQNASKV